MRIDESGMVHNWDTVQQNPNLTGHARQNTKGFGLDEHCLTAFKVTVWEDNDGCLTLANLAPGQQTPRSKFYDCKVHWFLFTN
jgi:hypothetical protein